MEEICPFKREEPFWKRAGGLQGTQDCNGKNFFVRGGEWRVSMTNVDNSDASVTMYLGFCKDGTDYRTLAGDVRVPWSPYIAMEDIGQKYRISKWKQNFVLKCGVDNVSKGETRVTSFKVGSFPVDATRFIDDKKGWPFLWVTWRGMDKWHVKMKFELEFMVLFTDTQPHGLSSNEMRNLQKDIQELKSAMYATGDAQMNQ